MTNGDLFKNNSAVIQQLFCFLSGGEVQLTEKLKNEVKTFNPLRSLIIVVLVIAAAYLVALTLVPAENLEAEGGTLGLWSCVPAVFLVVYIFATKRVLEGLILGSVVGLIFAAPSTNVIGALSTTATEVMMDEDTGWLIIVCGLMGAIIKLIEVTGGAQAFGDWAARKAKSREATLMWTYVLGCIIFIDDYLNSMTIGSCMKKLTDKRKVSREMLSYVTSSTAAPLCALIPISTWAIFAGRIMVDNGYGVDGKEIQSFITTIPYSFYAWAAALLVPLVIWHIVPVFGPMKKAEERALSGGPLAPPGSEKIDLNAGEVELKGKPKLYNLAIPIIGMVFFTIIFDLDMQYGVIATMALCFVLFIGQKLLTAEEFWDYSIEGIKNMILPLTLMVLAYIFASVNDTIGFTRYVIDIAVASASVQLLPVLIFALLAVTEFVTGTNWGMYIIALPIVIPICMETGIPVALGCGAVISAGVLGSHCCFYSDCTVITSSATGCDNFAHAWTQMPLGLLAGAVAAIGYLITGFVMI